MSIPVPTEIKKSAPTELRVQWDDDHISILSIKYLRCQCSCANCVSEVTGKRILDISSVPEDVSISGAQHVGSYGVQFYFDDGHSTGIYTWARLRELCCCDKCGPKPL